MKKFKIFYNTLKCAACVTLTIILVMILYGCKSKSILKRASKGLNSYTLSATYCDTEHTINATEKVNYTNKTGDALSYICFNMYGTAFSEDAKIWPYTTLNAKKCFPNGLNYGDMEVSSVRVNAVDASFSIVGLDNNALKVDFSNLLNVDESAEIEIVFKLSLANCTHRLGYFDDFVNLGNWYPILAVYENGEFNITPYYSSGDPFYSECANYNIEFNFPENMVLGHTGNITKESTTSGVKTVNIEAKAVRDFALTLSEKYKIKEASVGSTKIRVLADASDENLQNYLDAGVKAVNLFNKTFGEYPYATLDIAITPFLHGGMEYPNLVYIANDITDSKTIAKVIVHEIAHQWWYGVIGNNEIKDAWFDESLAEYSSVIFFENYPEYEITREQMITDCIKDYELYLDVVKSVNIKHNLSMQLPLNEYVSEYEYVYMVYVKGTIFIDELRKSLGDKDFFNGLKNLYKNNMFKVITKTEFIEAFNSEGGVDVTSFVEGYLSGNTEIK